MGISNLNPNGFSGFLLHKLREHTFSIIFAILVIMGAFIAIKISKKALIKALEKTNKKDTMTSKIALKGSKILIILISIFLILAKFKIPVTAFFAIISSGLLAFGLSLKDFFCNIAKSVQIFMMKPFSVGDLIEIDSKKGYVKKIDYMHTYIANDEHGLVMVPNSLIADKSIINYSRGDMKKKSDAIGLNETENVPNKIGSEGNDGKKTSKDEIKETSIVKGKHKIDSDVVNKK